MTWWNDISEVFTPALGETPAQAAYGDAAHIATGVASVFFGGPLGGALYVAVVFAWQIATHETLREARLDVLAAVAGVAAAQVGGSAGAAVAVLAWLALAAGRFGWFR